MKRKKTYQAFYLDVVRNDILVAKQWYDEQQEGLGERFTHAVKDALDNILKMPLAYSIRYREVRIAHTKVFPYNIHFYINEPETQIVIIGVIHNRRREALFLDR